MKQTDCEDIGELLSGYLDGELTQQDEQRVRVHCEDCAECTNTLQVLERNRTHIRHTSFGVKDNEQWREEMSDIAVKTSRSFGWLLFGGGLLLAAGLGVYEFLDSDVTTLHKLLAGAVYGGLFLLFVSVLRQRLIERKTDKYKDVEK